tara:strand:- start:128 stop:346 length:219 start_codon:yes stop_codon:yes gene_type:complete
MKKLFLVIVSSLFLSACYQNTAMIGPAITAGSSQNITQSAFSYVTSTSVKKATGKTPAEHVKSLLDDQKKIN